MLGGLNQGCKVNVLVVMTDHEFEDLVLENRVIPASTVASFSRFMGDVLCDVCGDEISFAFPASGVYHDLTRDRLEEFATALQSNTCISEITLITEVHGRSNDDFGDLWDAVGAAFGSMENLYNVTFQRTDPWDLDAIARIVRKLQNITNLTILLFPFPDQVPELDGEMISNMANSIVELQHLGGLSLVNIPSAFASDFVGAISKMDQLNWPELAFMPENTIHIEPTAFGNIFHSRSLRRLDLSRFSLDESTCIHFARALRNGIGPNHLHLQECHFHSPLIVFQALKTTTRLETVVISYQELDRPQSYQWNIANRWTL